ncbi:hypothetical protein N9L68_02635 [bacterium]|nr:hypothetical protein [bacterium]
MSKPTQALPAQSTHSSSSLESGDAAGPTRLFAKAADPTQPEQLIQPLMSQPGSGLYKSSTSQSVSERGRTGGVTSGRGWSGWSRRRIWVQTTTVALRLLTRRRTQSFGVFWAVPQSPMALVPTPPLQALPVRRRP